MQGGFEGGLQRDPDERDEGQIEADDARQRSFGDDGAGTTAEEQTFAYNLMVDAQRVSALDDLWTATLKADPDPRSRLPALQTMVGDLVGGLTSVAGRADRLESLIDRIANDGIDLERELFRVLISGGMDPTRKTTTPDRRGPA